MVRKYSDELLKERGGSMFKLDSVLSRFETPLLNRQSWRLSDVMMAIYSHEKPDQERGTSDPGGNDDTSRQATDWSSDCFVGCFPVLFHYSGGDESDDYQDPEGHDHQIVQIAKHWDEIRDQVDG